MKASQEAIDWLDENARDGGFLFSHHYANGEAVYLAGGIRGDSYSPAARSILGEENGTPAWQVGKNPVYRPWAGDVPLSDERLQEFLDAYGFKPVDNRETLTIPIDEVRVGDELLNVGVVERIGAYGSGVKVTCGGETLTTYARTHPVTVVREKDPDDELIDVLVKEGFGEWYTDNLAGRDTYRRQMKMAVTKAREAGLL